MVRVSAIKADLAANGPGVMFGTRGDHRREARFQKATCCVEPASRISLLTVPISESLSRPESDRLLQP